MIRQRGFSVIRRAAVPVVAISMMLVSWQLPAADSDPAAEDAAVEAEAAEEDTETLSLFEMVEITVNSTLRSTGRTDHVASVTVENISVSDIDGPLGLVVEATGLEGLTLENGDGSIGDLSYIEIVRESAQFKAGDKLRPTKLEFSSEDMLTLEERGSFVLTCRVEQLDADAIAANDELIDGKSYSQSEYDRVAALQEAWTAKLWDQAEGLLYGTDVGEDENGNLIVHVFTQRQGVKKMLPDSIEGVKIEQVVIGQPFRAGPDIIKGDPVEPGDVSANGVEAQAVGPAGGTTLMNRPVRNGDSGGHPTITAGTTGVSLFDKMKTHYILTNNHVAAASNAAMINDPFLQPGPIDGGMVATDSIGFLVWFKPVKFAPAPCGPGSPKNKQDAALVRVFPGLVASCTPPDGYGNVKKKVVKRKEITIGMPVQKYGRTTLLTTGFVTGKNFQGCVNYGAPGLAFFKRQLMVNDGVPGGGTFSAGGDSGSIIVGDGGTYNRQLVGLLFAGGGELTIANYAQVVVEKQLNLKPWNGKKPLN